MPGSGHGVVCRPGKRRATGHYYADAVTPGGATLARPTTGAVRFVGPRKRSATGRDCADAATPGGATLARPTTHPFNLEWNKKMALLRAPITVTSQSTNG